MRRIVRNYNGDMTKVRLLDMEYYIVRKDGAYAGCSLWSTSPTGRPRVFTVHDEKGYRVEKCAALLEGRKFGVAAVLRRIPTKARGFPHLPTAGRYGAPGNRGRRQICCPLDGAPAAAPRPRPTGS